MAKITPTEKKKYEEIIKSRFSTLFRDAKLAMQGAKEQLTHSVKQEWEIYEIQRAISEQELKLKELKEVFAKRMKLDNFFGQSYEVGNAVDAEVERRLEASGTNLLAKVADAEKEAIEAVWLADTPQAVVALLESLTNGKMKELTGQLAAALAEAPKVLELEAA